MGSENPALGARISQRSWLTTPPTPGEIVVKYRIDAVTQVYIRRRPRACLRPRLVVIDPFVRLHRIDENTASEVAPLLAYLR